MRGNRQIVDTVTAETRIYVIVLVGLVAFCSSCKKNRRKENVLKIVKEWTGKEVRFPKALSCTSMGKDTACIDVYENNYKILLYVDSLGCTSCRLKLSEWKKIMREADTTFIRKPEFVFIFQPKKRNKKELQTIFKSNGFRHPVFIDKDDEIAKINKFPLNPEYQCFLLDKDNKVLLVGNPSLVSGIWFLYKKIINERETKVLTMEKGGELIDANETTTLPPRFPLKRKNIEALTRIELPETGITCHPANCYGQLCHDATFNPYCPCIAWRPNIWVLCWRTLLIFFKAFGWII